MPVSRRKKGPTCNTIWGLLSEGRQQKAGRAAGTETEVEGGRQVSAQGRGEGEQSGTTAGRNSWVKAQNALVRDRTGQQQAASQGQPH